MERWCNTKENFTKIVYTWAIDDFRDAFAFRDERLSSARFDEEFPLKMQWQFHLGTSTYDESCTKNSPHLYFEANLNKLDGPSTTATIGFSIIMPNGSRDYINAKKVTLNAGRHSTCFYFERDLIMDNLSRLTSNDRLTVRFTINLDNVADKNPTVIHNSREDLLILSENLGRMLEKESFADVTLIVGDQSFRAHKVVLAAQSDVFAAMFQHDMLENSTNKVSIPDVSPEVFRETLHFIYTGRVRDDTILEKMALEMIAVADKYALDELKELCEQSLIETICPKTAAEILIVAETHNVDQLKSYAIAFIKGNIAKVSLTSGWCKLLNTHEHLVKEFSA